MSFLLLFRLLGLGWCSGSTDFQQMRVKELRAYLAARNAACTGCTEKHEFVSMAMAVQLSEDRARAKTKTKSKPKPTKSKPKPKSTISSPSKDISFEIFTTTTLLVLCMSALWRSCWHPARRTMYRWKKQRHQDAITLKRVRDPYRLRCCGQVCERKALALWMQASQLARLRDDGIIQRVAQCQLCRGVFEPSAVRSLLDEFDLNITVEGDFAIESRICDPAFARGEVNRQHFIRMMTKKELEEEMRNFAVNNDENEEEGEALTQHVHCRPSAQQSEASLVVHANSSEVVSSDGRSDADNGFSVGDRVTLSGLNAAEYNGESGIVIRDADASGRLGVQLDATGLTKKIKPQNLKSSRTNEDCLELCEISQSHITCYPCSPCDCSPTRKSIGLELCIDSSDYATPSYDRIPTNHGEVDSVTDSANVECEIVAADWQQGTTWMFNASAHAREEDEEE